MIEEIQKRPFVRPLFLWITGILLYVFLPFPWLLYTLAALSSVIVIFIWISRDRGYAGIRYDCRWVWGVVISICFVSLSVEVCYYKERRMGFAGDGPSPVTEMAAQAQSSLVDAFDRLRLSDEEKSILATLTLGYKKAVSREVKKRFSVAGVSHILAVSGFHVAVVCGMLSLFCSFIPRRGIGGWVRYLILVMSLWGFAFITGLAPSAVRAALMLSLYLTGRVWRRATDGYNTLAAAAFCMLAYDPYYLFDIGFQLSYLAVFFILFLTPRIKGMIGVRNPLLRVPWEWIAVSVAAQVGTAWLCFYYFGQFSTVFLFTNLPVTFLATCLIPSAFFWLCYPEGFWGFGMIQRGVEWLVRALTRVVELFSDIPHAAITGRFGLPEMLGGYLALVLCLIYLKIREPKVLLAALSLLLIFSLDILIGRILIAGN